MSDCDIRSQPGVVPRNRGSTPRQTLKPDQTFGVPLEDIAVPPSNVDVSRTAYHVHLPEISTVLLSPVILSSFILPKQDIVNRISGVLLPAFDFFSRCSAVVVRRRKYME